MNHLLAPSPDVITDRARTHWIDTDVMLEVYSHGDLYKEWALRELGVKADPEDRRVRMQGSLWMAMSLCQLRAVSISYQHENLRNLLRLAPPKSDVGVQTSTILYVLGDGGVFSGWERLMTKSGEALSDRDRDRLMVRVCAPNPIIAQIPGITPERERQLAQALTAIREHTPGPLVLVTRDAELIRKARAVGVDADHPEAFAERTMPQAVARAMFQARLEQAINRYIARGSLDEWKLRVRAMERVRQIHDEIWSPTNTNI